MKTILVDLTPYQTMHRHRGIGRYVLDLARGLGALRSDEVRVLGLATLSPTGAPTILEDLGTLAPIVADVDLRANDARARWLRRARLGAAARHVGASFVHLPDARGTPLGVRRVPTCHDLIPLRFPGQYLDWRDGYSIVRRRREIGRYRDAVHVVAISEETRHDLVRLLDVPVTRVSVVHNGTDLTQWKSAPDPIDIAVVERHGLADVPYVLYVGGLEWRKNAEGMLAAIARAGAELELDLAFVGLLDEGELCRLRALAQSLGVPARLRPLGYVSDADLAALYRRSVAHLLISRAEGFGLTLVEAMACGAPVVATAGSSLAEVAGEAAILVDPDDVSAIAAALVSLTRDLDLRESLRKKGVARAARFSREACAAATLRVYERVAGES